MGGSGGGGGGNTTSDVTHSSVFNSFMKKKLINYLLHMFFRS
jgi:hypothetical protein